MLSRPDFALTGGASGGASEARARAADAAVPPGAGAVADAAEAACSVSDLNRRARILLEGGIGRVRVHGEISGFTRAASGHLYFSLKDDAAQVRCALWRSKAGALAFEPKNGDAVEVRAAVTLFEARGEYQLSIESMRRAGAGALYEQFLRLKEKLAGEGLFEAARKRKLPAFPRGIGIVTSLQAAALRDVLTTLARRAPMIPLIVFPAPVQGGGAAELIASAITAAGEHALPAVVYSVAQRLEGDHAVARGSRQGSVRPSGIDVLIVCRGGGSMEDLWAFNEETVARAIASCPVPVVSGVGHETDFTIADWVADLRAPTPTAAAELVSPDIGAMQAQLAAAAAALTQAAARHLANAQQRLDWLTRALVPPSARLAWQRQGLMHLCTRLRAAAAAALAGHAARRAQAQAGLRAPALARYALQLMHARKRLTGAALDRMVSQEALLERLSGALQMLNPQRVLERGFAIVSDAQGRVVRDGARLTAGDPLAVRLARGAARVTVVDARGETAAPDAPPDAAD